MSTAARARILVVAIVAILCAGCTRGLATRLVDASTGQPLAGVSTKLHSYTFDYILGEGDRHTDLPVTGPDGLVAASGLSTRWSHSFLFQKDGYQDAGAAYSAGDDLLAWDSPVPKPGMTPDAALRVKGGVAVIPLHRRSTTDSK